MKKENIIQTKSLDFAIKSVELYKKIVKSSGEYVIPRQFLKSSTSIGANVEEAIGAQSQPDFISKISIAYKEARETRYWLKLMLATNYYEKKDLKNHLDNLEEILKIIASIIKTMKST